MLQNFHKNHSANQIHSILQNTCAILILCIVVKYKTTKSTK